MSWFSNFLGGGKNPADSGMDYLNQIPGATKPYYQPYIDQGNQAGNDLTGRYGQMLNNPGELYNQLGAGYKESPGYQARLRAGLSGATNAAAAGGMAGSMEHQQHAAETANDLQGKDFEDYLNHVLGLYGQGVSGEQGREARGYNASTGYGDILGSNLGQQGGLAYNGQAGQNQNQSNLWGNIIKGGSMFAPGVGGAIGGLNLLQPRSYG